MINHVSPIIVSVQIGGVKPLGPESVPSGFVKSVVTERVSVATLGLEGDAQADLSVHGGSEKAVYGYSLANYALWQKEYPQHVDKFQPGGVGENLTIQGQDESNVCIGDIVKIGSAKLQVTQPRQPCFKFALRFDDKTLPRAMVKNGRSGWYYRVLEEGQLQQGDRVELIERPNLKWPIARFVSGIARHSFTIEDLRELVSMQGLAATWRESARAGLE